jgi:hypothetical protein
VKYKGKNGEGVLTTKDLDQLSRRVERQAQPVNGKKGKKIESEEKGGRTPEVRTVPPRVSDKFRASPSFLSSLVTDWSGLKRIM